MYAGFNLIMSKEDEIYLKQYAQPGEKLFLNRKRVIRDTLDKYINVDGSLNVAMIEEEWFKNINSHVFISHSHTDENLVKAFAGYLYESFGIESFIDSCVWGYANELLKMIDDRFCKTIKNEDGSCSYDYDKRNQSTSHVHMILNGALAKMINSTECLIFMNTPNSIKARDTEDKDKTASPWIYSELLMATEFPHQELMVYRPLTHYDEVTFELSEVQFEYKVKVDELKELKLSDLKELNGNRYQKNPLACLDELYCKKGMITYKQVRR